jgi:type II secretory pathway pseudopilin PulG
MHNGDTHNRAGITLMEVLISLGILSVGLASVVALIPAGGSQARKAQIEDRRGALGAAALADVVTRGGLNPSNWSTVPASPHLYRLVIDPLGNGTFPSATGLTSVTISNINAATSAADEVFRGQDDLVYDGTQSDDNPPVPMFLGNAKRSSEGNFSWLATLVPATTDSNPQYFRISVVEFHRRDVTTRPSIDPFPFSSPTINCGAGITNDEFRELFPVGAAVLATGTTPSWEWRRVVMAAPTMNSSGLVTAVDLSFERPLTYAANSVYAFKGSAGYVERVVSLERTSPWTQ